MASARLAGSADDYDAAGPPSTGWRLDVDGDGEHVATLEDGAWSSREQRLADMLNAFAGLLGDVSDAAVAADAADLVGAASLAPAP